MITNDYREAAKALFGNDGRTRHGTFRKKDGTLLSGLLSDLESPANDPEGIGYFFLELKDGSYNEITFDEFDALIDVW